MLGCDHARMMCCDEAFTLLLAVAWTYRMLHGDTADTRSSTVAEPATATVNFPLQEDIFEDTKHLVRSALDGELAQLPDTTCPLLLSMHTGCNLSQHPAVPEH